MALPRAKLGSLFKIAQTSPEREYGPLRVGVITEASASPLLVVVLLVGRAMVEQMLDCSSTRSRTIFFGTTFAALAPLPETAE